MSNGRGCWLILTLWLGLAGCSGIKLQVMEDRGLAQRLPASYAWSQSPLSAESSESLRRVDRSVRATVAVVLPERGYRAVARRDAQLLLDYRLSQRREYTEPGGTGSPRDEAERIWDAASPRGATQSPLSSHPLVDHIDIYELYFSVIDAVSGRLIWQAVARKQLEDELSVKQLERLTQQATERLCKELPVP